MIVRAATILFVDASCLFVAAKSPLGGSAYVLRVCHLGFVRACTSSLVLQETERNLLAKASPSLITVHRAQLAESAVQLVAVPPATTIQQFNQEFGKDDHVVACTLAARADFLITLDRPLITRVRSGGHPVMACTPKEFLQEHFVTHPDYERIRSLD